MRRESKTKIVLLTSVAFVWSSFAAAVFAQDAGHLPAGGNVVAGSATLSSPSGTSLLVTQSSPTAIVNWSSFSIGEGRTVRFENGAGATLNRVTGFSRSQIDGALSASGSLYIVNPNGITVGPSGVVSTGGSFVASTQAISDQDFLAGGALLFRGDSTASVISYGAIGALGGDVALIARKVENTGSISAPNGAVGLLAGYEVLIHDGALSDGKFVVKVGGADTEARTSGVIEAASVELRANGGNVYALSGNMRGITKATGVANAGGRVFLTGGDGGKVDVSQKIVARGSGFGGKSRGGRIRVSAGEVKISGSLDARGESDKGGQIVVTGRDIALAMGADVDVSGTEGGTILVGGDYQGGRSASIRYSSESLSNAESVSVAAGASLRANGTAQGGGAVVVWSDSRTVFDGALSATGVTQGGRCGGVWKGRAGLLGHR